MRPTPFDLAFGPLAEERFPGMRESLAASGRDPHDLDAFVLDRAVVTFLRELVPEEGAGDAVEQHLALLHHAYLYWAEGGWVVRLGRDRARGVLAPDNSPEQAAPTPRAWYAQFPERLVWAELAPGEPHQPLDGLFVRPWGAGGWFALAVFSLLPGQDGFSVADADGYREAALTRPDGSALFSPVLPGGAAAGLHSLVGAEELLELAARTAPLAAEAVACAGGSHRPHQPVEVG